MLEPNLVGELIASEVEVKTGKQPSFAEVPAALAERRAELAALVEPLGLHARRDGHAPVGELARPADHRHPALPPERRDPQVRRLAQQHVRHPHARRGPRGRPRGPASTSALRNWLPELLAVSASSPFHEGVDTGLHSARTQVFTRFFPRCGVPDVFRSWDDYAAYVRFLYETGSIDEVTQLWWSVRPHLLFPTVELRICDGQPDVAEAQALTALMVAVTARCARAIDEGEPLPEHPHRLIEENTVARDPLRALRRADRPRPRRRRAGPRAARAARGVGAPGGRGDRRGAVAPDPRAERRRAADRAPRRGRLASRRSTPSRSALTVPAGS